jgi:hypothetical protein
MADAPGLDNRSWAWRNAVIANRSTMPLFLFRDGSIRELPVLPDGVEFDDFQDRRKRSLYVVLDAYSERRLLAAQPRRRTAPSSTTTVAKRAARLPQAA